MKNRQSKQLIISSYDDIKNPYYAGGGATAVHEVAKRLTDEYQVTVFTGNYPGAVNKTADGVVYERVGLKHGGPMLGQLAFSLCLPFLVMTKQYDVWLESFTPPFSTNCLQLFTKKPVIGLVHMLSGEDMRRKYIIPFDWFERVGLQTYRSLIVLSEPIAKKIRVINRKVHIAVIPNGVSIDPLAKKTERKDYLLFLGRIEMNQKGMDLLLHAYASLIDRHTPPLYIAGEGKKADMDELRGLVRSLHLSSRVRLLGKVTGHKKEQLYREASCIVLSSRFETFSMTALEAMAHACPLITFDLTGLSWIPANCRIVVKKLNADLLAKAMRVMLENKQLQRTLSTNEYTFAKSFTWDTIVEQYKKTITAQLSRKS